MQLIQHDYTDGSLLRDKIHVDAHLIIADPPYNYGLNYADDETGDNLDNYEYAEFIEDTVAQLDEMLAPDGLLMWICPHSHGERMYRKMEPFFDFLYGGPVIWHEAFSQYQQHTLTKDYRFIFMAHQPDAEPTFNPDAIRVKSKRQEMGDKRADPRGRVPGMVWDIRRLQGTSKDHVDWHPAQLPPELIERLILGWTNPGDVVLDAFAGSGNTGVACKKLGRQYIGVDKSPTYLEKIKERLSDASIQAQH